MTVPELVDRILHTLETQFYCDLPRRDFLRDQDYLVAAIGTYGWECYQRGWEFDIEFIYAELCRLLTSFKRSGTQVTFMPLYLQNAIRQHIREHAEELKPKARQVAPAVKRVTDGLRLAEIIREPTPAQMAACIYRDVKRLRREKRAALKARTSEEKRQRELI